MTTAVVPTSALSFTYSSCSWSEDLCVFCLDSSPGAKILNPAASLRAGTLCTVSAVELAGGDMSTFSGSLESLKMIKSPALALIAPAVTNPAKVFSKLSVCIKAILGLDAHLEQPVGVCPQTVEVSH